MQTGPKIAGNVDWHLKGPNRPFLGNGYTLAEGGLTYVSAILFTVFAVAYWWIAVEAPTLWQAVLLAVVAYDVQGGVVANSLNSCKRFYHAADIPAGAAITRAFRNSLLFTVCHVHPIIFAFAFGFPLVEGVAWYGVLCAAVLLVTVTPLYLRRPLATAFSLAAIIFSQTVFALPTGLEWLIPGLFLKLVLGHSVQEEPYRP